MEDHTPRRPNAILARETVEEIAVSLATVNTKLDFMSEKLENVARVHEDHEVRIRALEHSHATLQGSTGAASWLYTAIWPVVSLAMALLVYFKP